VDSKEGLEGKFDDHDTIKLGAPSRSVK
jgi:hypothetical protein